MDLQEEFEKVRESARGLTETEPELKHSGLEPAWNGESFRAEDLKTEYFRLVAGFEAEGKDRPHRRARDCLIVCVGDTEHNLGSLLDACFDSPLAKDSAPKKDSVTFA